MTALIYIVITLFTFVLMEGITWLTHKYVMHGFLWYLHKDHHQPNQQNRFEKNDSFFLIFATPCIMLCFFGVRPNLNYLFFIGLGIFIYGMAYFLIHDVLIHQRFKWFRNVKNKYLLALRRAHKVHHKHLKREDGECFGMLLVPFKYYRLYHTK
ncbi:sterol desaturase family protein [Mangrovimonas aestuarii]|uniref:sterol desaturase family protein n=1 Tax=Mangrovimonas aestuarii TaxID=3018443 RepID=UPI002379DACA|nr:sterol desaturase family protein [Mangrovimonas aestuarii]